MYCFSKFCCICFNKRKNLEELDKNTRNGSTYFERLSFCIPEIDFQGLRKVLLICKECKKKINMVYDFRLDCLKNIKSMKRYNSKLRSFGNTVGDMKIELIDVNKQYKFEDLDRFIKKENNFYYDFFERNDNENTTENERNSQENVFIKEERIDEPEMDAPDSNPYANIKLEPEIEVEFLDVQNENIPVENKPPASASNYQYLYKRKNYICEICCRCFIRSYDFHRHRLSHENEKPINCKICNKIFTRKSSLKKHQLTHTESTEPIVKGFTCKICYRTFPKLVYLHQHEVTHKHKKVYHCDVCNKFFDVSNNRKKHHSHAELKRFTKRGGVYNCKFCWKTYGDLGRIRKHQMRHSVKKEFIPVSFKAGEAEGK